MSYVISANYFDRSSPNRWLVRHESDPIEKAVPIANIDASRIRIVEAGPEERARGCFYIAVAEEIEQFKAEIARAHEEHARRAAFDEMEARLRASKARRAGFLETFHPWLFERYYFPGPFDAGFDSTFRRPADVPISFTPGGFIDPQQKPVVAAARLSLKADGRMLIAV